MPFVYTPPSGAPFPTGWDWVERVREHVEGPSRSSRALLADNIDDTQEAVGFTHGSGSLAVGQALSVGLETLHVWSAGGGSATVLRGADATTPAPHLQGDIVYINSQHTNARIWRALQEEVAALASAGLWVVGSIERAVTSFYGTDLADDLIGDQVVEIKRKSPSDSTGMWKDIANWDVLTNVDPTDYPSGKAVVGPWNSGDTLRITYKAVPGQLTDPATDPLAQCGIQATASDLPPVGAAIRLLASFPPARANPMSQPTPRRQGETSTTDTINSGNALRSMYQQRLGQEIAALHAQFPMRLSRWSLSC